MVSDPGFNAAFQRSSIGQYPLAPTDMLEILAVNDAFLCAVSQSPEGLLGMPLLEVLSNDSNYSHVTGARNLGVSIRAAIDTGQSQLMPVQRYSVEINKDGRSWLEDMYWSATNTPFYNADGKLACVSHMIINITVKVLAEQACCSAGKKRCATPGW